MNNFDYDAENTINTDCILNTLDDLKLKIQGRKVCLFLGAGFSKAWDEKYPLSSELFGISNEEAEEQKDDYPFFELFESLGLKWGGAETNNENERFSIFRTFKYMIDVYNRYPSLLPSHLDKYTLAHFEKDVKKYIKNKFVGLVPVTDLNISSKNNISTTKRSIVDFLDILTKSNRLDIITTNYDTVIDKAISKLDPKVSTLRGIPIKTSKGIQCPIKNGIGLYKINGGFEVIEEGDSFKIDYESIREKNIIPNIILPSNEQNYSDKYFKNTFMKASSQLRNADILIFIGYSFPPEDFIISFLLKSFLDAENINKETLILSRDGESAKKCHDNAKEIFKELNDKSGLFYFSAGFNEICKSAL